MKRWQWALLIIAFLAFWIIVISPAILGSKG